MTLTAFTREPEHVTGAGRRVTAAGGTIRIDGLLVRSAEASAIVAAESDARGPDSAADLVARAIPVGLLAVSVTNAGVDTGAVRRTLDGFATDLDIRSKAAVAEMQAALDRIRTEEHAVADTAQRALADLPARLDKVLAGEADTVRDAVTKAAQQVQAAGLDDLRRALSQHSDAMRSVLSLDSDGPIQTLRRDMLAGLDGTRRELSAQLAAVRELLAAAAAAKVAGAKSSQALGKEFETQACALIETIAVAAGDQWDDTGSAPAPGTTRRSGDGVATLSRLVTGGADVRIVVEAKKRGRPLAPDAWRKELADARENRKAVAALAIVPSVEDVPGGGGIYRLGERAFVVAIDQPVDIVYQVLRELAVVHSVGTGDAEIDLGMIESNLQEALSALLDWDKMGRLIKTASASLENAREIGGHTRTRIQKALDAGLAALHA